MRGGLTILFLLALLGASVAVAWWAWQEIGDVEMSRHGLIALGLGAGVTFLLGAGLMALVFFSDRRGYDAQAHRPDDQPPPRRDDAEPPDSAEPPQRL